MNKVYALAILFASFLLNTASAQSYRWASYGNSIGFDYGNALVVDDTGNVYVAGQFEYDFYVQSIHLSTMGQHDIFVAKFDSAGTLKWIRQGGGSDGDAAVGIDIDAAGNVYVTGEIETTCYFFQYPFTDSLVSTGFNDAFIVKYNNAGTRQWLKKSAYSNKDERGKSLVADADGNFYTTGSYTGNCNMGGVLILPHLGSGDGYLAKFNSNGNLIWAKGVSSSGEDKGRNVALDNDGNVYLTATYKNNCSIGGTTITGTGRQNSLLAKFDSSGTLRWVRTAYGSDTTRAAGLSVDASGNVYVTGYFQDTTYFGSQQLIGYGNYDIFIVKYDSSGNVVWAKQEGGPYEDIGYGLDFNQNTNQFYVTGQFDDHGEFGGVNRVSNGQRDMFVCGYDTAGNALWFQNGGGSIRDAGYGVGHSPDGAVYVTGFYDTTASFGLINVPGYSTLAEFMVTKINPAVTGQPTTITTNLNISLVNCNEMQLTWTNGNGARRIVLAHAVSAVSSNPVDGTGYSASSTFGSGSQIGSGNYVVYDGTGSTVTVTGLSAGTRYYYSVYEYNGYAASSNYLTSSFASGNLLNNAFSTSVSAAPSSYCAGGSTTLSVTNGVSATWSPAGGLSATSGLSVTANPTITTTYTALITDAGGCQSSKTITVTVNDLPLVDAGIDLQACISGSSISLFGAPSGGTYSGPGVSANAFNPATAGIGTHTITYSYTDANGCSNTDTRDIQVTAPPTVTFSAVTSFCINDPSYTLVEGSPAGGTYSGTGVTAGQFDPAVSGAGTFALTYTYSDASGCGSSASRNVTVNPLPTVTLGSFTSVCANDAAFNLNGGSPSGGDYFVNDSLRTQFDPPEWGAGTYSVRYEFTNANGCKNTATSTILVNALPNVQLSSFASKCINSGLLTLSGGTPAGGSYSGTGVSGNSFNPAVSGVGTFTITYSYSDANGCGNSATQTITVNDLPTVNAGTYAAVCQNSGGVTLNGGTPSGGSYSGTNVSGNTFTPSTVGSNTINYSYTDGNGCSNLASTTITVNALPTVSINSVSPVCEGSTALISLSGSPSGGTFSGTGVSGNSFDPTGLAANTYAISYSVTDANSCSNSASTNMVINPLPNVTFSNPADVCANAGPVTLNTGSPLGGIYSGTNVVGNLFDPTGLTPGVVSLSYSYTDANSCSNSATASIIVNGFPVIYIGQDSTICSNQTIVLDAGSGYASYSWSTGALTQTISLDSTMLNPGPNNITCTVTDANQCSGFDVAVITRDLCLGVETAELIGASVYPNPFSNLLNVLTNDGKTYQLEVSNATGQLIYNASFSKDLVIATDKWAQGIYILKISNDTQFSALKFIKTN